VAKEKIEKNKAPKIEKQPSSRQESPESQEKFAEF
jgi:hypothetical protein